jgi:uncharacterized protein YndB with AHSA1/START domain
MASCNGWLSRWSKEGTRYTLRLTGGPEMATIRHSISIDASPERIFPLVSSGHGFSQWWAADVSEDVPRNIVSLGFFDRGTVYNLKPARIITPTAAEWACQSGEEWNGTVLLFDLLPQKQDRTLLRFSHMDWRAETDYFVACTTTWGELMFRLKATAEGKTPGPLFSATGMAY